MNPYKILIFVILKIRSVQIFAVLYILQSRVQILMQFFKSFHVNKLAYIYHMLQTFLAYLDSVHNFLLDLVIVFVLHTFACCKKGCEFRCQHIEVSHLKISKYYIVRGFLI